MPRTANIFYKIVNDENSMTELLCNMMRFADFRRSLLEKIFPDSTCAGRVEYKDIDTQHGIGELGKPDITIENDDIYAFVEVKVEPYRSLTDNQPDGYYEHLRNDENNGREHWLVFLVPEGWTYERSVRKQFNELESANPGPCIKTGLVYWQEVLAIIEKNDLQKLSLLFHEFYRLLSSRYRIQPVKFTNNELRMIFNNEIPKVLSKLDEIIEQIKNMDMEYSFRPTHGGKTVCIEYNGLSFFDNQDQEAFFFGEWTEVWNAEMSPLCFGVNADLPYLAKALAAADVLGDFNKDAKTYNGCWRMKTISQEMLVNENNAAERIWKEIKPVLEKVKSADQGQARPV